MSTDSLFILNKQKLIKEKFKNTFKFISVQMKIEDAFD